MKEKTNENKISVKGLMPRTEWPDEIKDNIRKIYGIPRFFPQETRKDFSLGYVLVDGKKKPATKGSSGEVKILEENAEVENYTNTWSWDGDKWLLNL